jgi:hypothetical protein
MEAFYCVCRWQAAYACENSVLMHVRLAHPELYNSLLIIRRSTDYYEYDKMNFPRCEEIDLSVTETKEVKLRLCKLASMRKRLP